MLEDGTEVTYFDDYTVVIKAIQVPIFINEIDKDDIQDLWKFIVEFHDSNIDSIVEIPSYRTYSTYEDAVQDAYGVIDLFGFTVSEDTSKNVITILRWSVEDEELYEDYVLFDGLDFYPVPEDFDPDNEDDEEKND